MIRELQEADFLILRDLLEPAIQQIERSGIVGKPIATIKTKMHLRSEALHSVDGRVSLPSPEQCPPVNTPFSSSPPTRKGNAGNGAAAMAGTSPTSRSSRHSRSNMPRHSTAPVAAVNGIATQRFAGPAAGRQ